MNAKKVLAGSLLTLAATGFAASPAAAAAEDGSNGDYSQNVNIIDDICPTIQDIDLLITIEVLDEARATQCHEARKHSKINDESKGLLSDLADLGAYQH